jgi:hypothetical protein
VETIERRLLLATYMVTTVADGVDANGNDLPGSLRQAIDLANNDTTPDTIQFLITDGGPQMVKTIQPVSTLPPITNTVTIDGTTQPGYAPGAPVVVIDGSKAGPGNSDLTIQASNSIVQGLSIVNSTDAGITISQASGVKILSNLIGVLPGVDNQLPLVAPNLNDGIDVSSASGNFIGLPGAGNLIGGNGRYGVSVLTSAIVGTISSNNLIQGNFIGVLPFSNGQIGLGPQNYGNGSDGINLAGASSNTIGGETNGAGNFISGNLANGVDLISGSGNLLQGNRIGVRPNGAAAQNSLDGVVLLSTASNTIGGPSPGDANVISGNSRNGVDIQPGSTGNLVQGNTIGLDVTGTMRLSNGLNGIFLQDAPANTIGGTIPGSSNVVSGNGGNGIQVQGVGASGNLIEGNVVGTNAAGSNDPTLGNSFDGIDIKDSARNTIGGTAIGSGNIIALNQGSGVHIQGGGSTATLVLGNHIGTDLRAQPFLGNFHSGVNIESSSGNTIGGTTPAARNFIVSSQVDAIDIQSTDVDAQGHLLNADFNVVQGNDIGISLDPQGNQVVLQNVNNGLFIVASHNTIGGTAAGAGNVISENLSIGITVGSLISPAGPIRATGNVIQGNIIGLDNTGTQTFGNGRDGIQLIGAFDTLIAGNVISGNTIGMEIFSPNGANEPLGDLIIGNVIGLGIDGQQLSSTTPGGASLQNTSDGIIVEAGAQGVTIGGTAPGSANVISGNGSSGIRFASASFNDVVEGNLIGLAKDGRTPRANNQSGVFIGEASHGITIGGTTPGSGNVISANTIGITVTNAGSSNNLVEGNTIGLALDGQTAVGNLGFGVLLLDGVEGNTIGGTTPGARNVISSNGQGVGIVGPNSTGNLIEGDYIGLDSTGSLSRGNLQLGLFLNGAAGNAIGGTSPGAGNVISGNTGVGLLIFGPGSTANLVAGNIVGLDATGSRSVDLTGQSLGNANFGIQIGNAPNNTIGGTAPGARNVISGNRQAGIDIAGPSASGTVVEGNYVGIDSDGRVALGNLGNGILVDNAAVAVIGGAFTASRNVISGNLGSGVEIGGSGSIFDEVLGNFIGTDASGLVAVPNGQSGVFVNGSPGVTIGGTIASLRNVISGNGLDGVRIFGGSAGGSIVLGNYIGVDATGRAALGNGNDGVLLDSTAGVLVGGTAPGSSNVISANVASGVEFGGNSSAFDVVQGNLIGTDAGGVSALGNSTGVFVNNAPFNTIGGTAPFSGNLISGNTGPGIHLFGLGAINNVVQGSRIGTDLAGLAPIANQAGIFIDGAPSNLIAGDLISGNTSAGLVIQGSGASGNVLQANLIGPDSTGTRAIRPASPQQSGVLIDDAPGNVVGGPTATARNVLSGNVVGVVIAGFNSQRNLVLGNFIGTDAAGRGPLANQAGVYINGSSSNTVGGATLGSGNLISGNTATGIDIYGVLSTANLVEGNQIGTDAAGTVAVPNSTGVFIELAASNTIGGTTSAAGNLISGNSVAGVYLFDGASGNLVQRNRIGIGASGKKLGNGQYGVLLFNAAKNTVVRSGPTANTIANSGIGNFREFTGSVTGTSTTPKKTKAVVKASHPTGPKASGRAISPRG